MRGPEGRPFPKQILSRLSQDTCSTTCIFYKEASLEINQSMNGLMHVTVDVQLQGLLFLQIHRVSGSWACPLLVIIAIIRLKVFLELWLLDGIWF